MDKLEKIAKFLYNSFNTISEGSWEELPKFNEVRQWWLMMARQILALISDEPPKEKPPFSVGAV